MAEQKYIKTIVLLTEELMQDIRNSGFIQSGAVVSENVKDKNRLTDVTEFNNVEAVTRFIDLAVGEETMFLFPYSKGWSKEHPTIVTDKYCEKDLYKIVLAFDHDNLPQVAFKHLRTLCHEYIVARVMYLYTNIAFPEMSETWMVKADELKHGILDSIKLGQKPRLRKLYPFY